MGSGGIGEPFARSMSTGDLEPPVYGRHRAGAAMTREVGTFSHGMDGPLRISVEAGRYRIEGGDAMVRRSGSTIRCDVRHPVGTMSSTVKRRMVRQNRRGNARRQCYGLCTTWVRRSTNAQIPCIRGDEWSRKARRKVTREPDETYLW
jgi:hypothetical protein